MARLYRAGDNFTVTDNADETGDRDLHGTWYFTYTLPDELCRYAGMCDAADTYVEATLFTATATAHWLNVRRGRTLQRSTPTRRRAASSLDRSDGQIRSTSVSGMMTDGNAITAYLFGTIRSATSVMTDPDADAARTTGHCRCHGQSVGDVRRQPDAQRQHRVGINGNAVNPDWNVTPNQPAVGTRYVAAGIALRRCRGTVCRSAHGYRAVRCRRRRDTTSALQRQTCRRPPGRRLLRPVHTATSSARHRPQTPDASICRSDDS